MKVAFRIIALLVSLWIVVFAFLPPNLFKGDGKKKKKPARTETASQEQPAEAGTQGSQDLNAGSQAIYDVLGGAQLETGQRAKNELNKVHEMRQERMGELGGYGPKRGSKEP